jgi:crossover junction endodeoxyribonuclease RusA
MNPAAADCLFGIFGMKRMRDEAIKLPLPPSINHYWRMARGRFYISDEGKLFRMRTASLWGQREKMDGKLAIDIRVFPPDRRRRDVDNVVKPLLDALQHAGAYNDDYQICNLHIERCEPEKNNGHVTVRLTETRQ